MRAKRRKWGVRRALSVWLTCLMLISSISLPVQAAEPQAASGERLEDTPENSEVSESGTDGESESPDQEAGAQESGETDTTEQPPDAAGSDGENQKPGVEEGTEQPANPGEKDDENQPGNPGTENGGEQPADPDSSDETQQPDTPDEEEGDETAGKDPDSETDGADSDDEELPGAENSQLKNKKRKAAASGDQETDEAVKLQVVYHTQEEIKAFLKESGAVLSDPVTFAVDPVTSAPYAAGTLSDQTQQSAVAMLNQIRYIAGLSYDVALDEEYAAASQAAALVNYANRALSHTPAQPEGMDDTLYSAGYNGAQKSNIAYSAAGPIGVGVPKTLNETLVQSWMEDGDVSNISRVGHRRWILNPSMGRTGFGAVVGDDESKNMSVMYSAVYAHDSSGSGSNLFGVAWPAQNMPVNYFSTEHPWSVSLGETVTASEIQVKLTRAGDGQTWNFSSEAADGYFNVDNGNYGQTGCIIFRPSDVSSYAAGDSFNVEITKNGASYVDYTVDFFNVSTGEENPDTPEDPDDTDKIKLFIAGSVIEDEVYDGQEISCSYGTLRDEQNKIIRSIRAVPSFAGTLADGSAYENTETAPTQVGEYTLTFSLEGEGADQYVLKNASYSFKITQKELTITADSLNVNIGGKLPALSQLIYKVDGLVEGDGLLTKPSFRYDPETITTEAAGIYEIVPYGADAGNNYSITYVNGTLKVTEEEIVDSGFVNQISWKLDQNGKLTIEGTGDWHNHKEWPDENGYKQMVHVDAAMPWADRKEDILCAEVRVTGATCLIDMFKGCSNLKNVELSGLDTDEVTSMGGMFKGCSSLKNLDLSNFNTSRVVGMSEMFSGCSGLESLDLSNFNTSQVTSMHHMFDGCSSLKSLDVSSFDTSKVTQMSGMFRGCSALTKLDVSGFNTANVEYMSFEHESINLGCDGMFHGCSGLQELDVSGFNTSKVKNMRGMFYDCRSLKSLDVSGFDVSNIDDYYGLQAIFCGCSSLTSLDLSSFSRLGKGSVDLSGMFENCSSLTSLNLENFHTDNVCDMWYMFAGCSSLKSLDVSGFDTSNVKGMQNMFSDCSSLTSLDLSNFNTANVDNMGYMFRGCSSLTGLNLSGFNTESVRGMRWMFYDCSSLTGLDLSSFDTGNVTYMNNMFQGCSKLETLDVSSFDTGKVYSMSGMFKDCSSLTSLDLSSFDMSSEQPDNVTRDDLFGNTYSPSEMPALLYLRTPRNCSYSIYLPRGSWYDEAGQTYTELPRDSETSIVLYRGGYPGDGTTNTKKFVHISGTNVKSKIYDRTADAYHGTAVVVDSAGKEITGVTLDWSYSGALADGTPYTDGAQAPAQAGSYLLTFTMTGTGTEQYILQKTEYPFVIHRKEATVTVPARVIELDGELPDLSAFSDYTVAGLVEGDELIRKPSFRYSAEHISTSKMGTYWIIPYGADAGNNYKLNYMDGELQVGSPRSVDLAKAEVIIQDITYDGRDHRPEPVVRYRDRILEKDVDYYVSYQPFPVNNVGEYTVMVYGEGCYYGTATAKFRVIKDETYGDIFPDDIPADGKIPEGLWIAVISEYDGYWWYTGKAVKPAVRVYDHTKLLQEKTDYTVSYAYNVNVNTTPADSIDGSGTPSVPTIIVKGKGNYSGTAKEYFDILPIDIGDWEVTGVEADDMTVAYNGRPQKPKPVLMRYGVKLNNTNYSIAYYRYNEEKGEEELLDSVKDPGIYSVEFRGKGNFTGSLRCTLTVTDSLKLVGKLKVPKIPDQAYADGNEITPAVTVKDGATTLEQDVHYTLEYRSNYGVGTAYAIITGIPEKGYSGTKRVAFKITGTPIKKAAVTFGTEFLPYVYNGTEIEAELWLTIKKKNNGTETTEYLERDRDYTLTWQKNENAGTASVTITGIGGYTGTVKKSFKINKYDIAANTTGQFHVVLEDSQIPYAKGGVKAKPTVTFEAGDGSELILTEGKDYTLSYRRHTKLTGEGTDQLAEITVKGKGNFSGTYQNKLYYAITRQDIGNLALTAQDKVYKNKKNIYATKVTVTDVNGKALKAGTDYDSAITYTYVNPTEVQDASANGTAVNRAAGDAVENNDIIPAGTVLKVKVTAKEGGSYSGSLEGGYRITQASIVSATVSVPVQTYTGKPVTLDKSDITVKVKGKLVAEDQWEIVPDSYKNNVKKGTASVTIRGVDNYGGTKTVKFTIEAKGVFSGDE